MIESLQSACPEIAPNDYRMDIEDGLKTRIGRLSVVVGGYLERVDHFERNIVGGELDEVFEQLLGQAPAVLYRTHTSSSLQPFSSRKVQQMDLAVEVFFFSNSLRTFSDRLMGSPPPEGDPGIYKMMADVRALLLGFSIAECAQAFTLSIEEPIIRGDAGGAIWLQTWKSTITTVRQPEPGQPVTIAEIEAQNELVESAIPSATTVTTITDPIPPTP